MRHTDRRLRRRDLLLITLAVSLATPAMGRATPVSTGHGQPGWPPVFGARPEPTPLDFSEFYSGGGARGLVLSDKLTALNGQRVVITGFMAPPLKSALDFFVLTRVPMALCPFCSSDAEWPEDIVFVRMPPGQTIQPTSAPVRVTGTLDLGTKADEATGFVSLVRILADTVEVLR